MDNFIPKWLKFNNLSNQKINKNDVKKKYEIKSDQQYVVEKDIEKNGLRVKYNVEKNKKLLNKSVKTPFQFKENNKEIKKIENNYNEYTDVCNFVDRYYYAPKVNNNPEIYLTSSDDDFSDNLDDFNYN